MSKKAMKLALDALVYASSYCDTYEAINALREALAEQPAQQQEPVALKPCWYESKEKTMCRKCGQIHAEAIPTAAQQEPVAWKLVPVEPTEEMLKAMDECSKEGYDERLYAGHAASVYMAAVDSAPTPPAQRKPLTDEELDAMFSKTLKGKKLVNWVARAIEAAHGIKENT